MRRAGSYSSIWSSRSRPFSSSSGTSFLVSSRDHFGNDDLKSGNDVTPGQVDSSGVPSTLLPHVNSNIVGGRMADFIPEDFEDLVDFRVTREQWLAGAHLGKD